MPDQLTIRVRLPDNRNHTGTLELISPLTGLTVFGPVPVLGRAARNSATAHGNPSRDATKPYGHTPLGTYQVQRIVSNGPGTTRPFDVYGRSGAIVLDPLVGQAAIAKANGRVGLLIHAGRQPNSPTPLPSQLKPTNGCIRMLDRDLATLIDAIRDQSFGFPGVVNVDVGSPGAPSDIDEAINDPEPPPSDGGSIILP